MADYIPIFLHNALEHYTTIKELVAVCPDDESLGRTVREYITLVDASGRQATDTQNPEEPFNPPFTT